MVHAMICAYDQTLTKVERRDRRRVDELLRQQFRMRGALIAPVHPVVGCLSLLAGSTRRFTVDKGLLIFSEEAEEAGRRMFRELVTTLPGDMVARWYGAVVLAARGTAIRDFEPHSEAGHNAAVDTAIAVQRPLIDHLNQWGAIYCLATLLVLSVCDIWLAVTAGFILVYFCGYTSLSYAWRHALPVQFVVFWGPCYLLGMLGVLATRLRVERVRTEWKARLRSPWRWIWKPLARMGVLFVVGAVILGVPLTVARAWQYVAVGKLVDRYVAADLEPLDWEERLDPAPGPFLSDVVYCPVDVPGLRCTDPDPCVGIRYEYLVADLEVGPDMKSAWVSIRYEDSHTYLDLRHTLNLREGESGHGYKYFFPVFEFTPEFRAREPGTVYSSFQGIGVQPDIPLRGLYRVRTKEKLPLAMNFWLPSDKNAFRWCQGITSMFPGEFE